MLSVSTVPVLTIAQLFLLVSTCPANLLVILLLICDNVGIKSPTR